jgi:hypothetical protein
VTRSRIRTVLPSRKGGRRGLLTMNQGGGMVTGVRGAAPRAGRRRARGGRRRGRVPVANRRRRAGCRRAGKQQVSEGVLAVHAQAPLHVLRPPEHGRSGAARRRPRRSRCRDWRRGAVRLGDSSSERASAISMAVGDVEIVIRDAERTAQELPASVAWPSRVRCRVHHSAPARTQRSRAAATSSATWTLKLRRNPGSRKMLSRHQPSVTYRRFVFSMLCLDLIVVPDVTVYDQVKGR